VCVDILIATQSWKYEGYNLFILPFNGVVAGDELHKVIT